MSTISGDSLLECLRWRYATKAFDSEKKISDEDWEALEESLVLTPSSFGLQPWKFLVVRNAELRERLVGHSWGQRQVADCSHLVVMAVMRKATPEHVERYIEDAANTRGVEPESLEGFKQVILKFLAGYSEEEATHWAKDQAYIALGQLMTAAALMGIDTCPMEGFSPPDYDEALGLEARGLTTAVLCCVGYRGEDKYAATPKVRFAREEVVERVD